MKLLLGGILTNNQIYTDYERDFIVETYQNMDCQAITDYKQLTDLIVEKHFIGKFYDTVIGHSMGGLILLDMIEKGYEINASKIILCESYLNTPDKKFRNIVFANQKLEKYITDIMDKQRNKFHPSIFVSLANPKIRKSVSEIKKALTFIYGMRGLDETSFKNALDFVGNESINVVGIPETSHFCLIERPEFFRSVIQNT